MSQQEPIGREKTRERPDQATSVVGVSHRRLDAVSKVIGEAEYAYDIDVPRMLHVETVHSPHPHATIIEIDTSTAEAMDGVAAVITGEDVPDNRYGGHIRDERVLPLEKVRYVGEPVAAVAAETERLAQKAANSINVTYEKLPAVFDIQEAYSTEPSVTVHEDLGEYLFTTTDEVNRDPDRPNVYAKYHYDTGDSTDGFSRADTVYEESYSTGRLQHVQMEPHVTVAKWTPDGELQVTSSTNMTFQMRNLLSTVFDVPTSKVNVIVPYVGGSFGGKEGATEFIAAAVAQYTDYRPVKLAFSRQDQFIDGTYRSPFEITVKVGVTDDQRITALKTDVFLGGGAYAGNGFLITRNCYSAAVGLYDLPEFEIDSSSVYTNLPPAGPVRGFGTPQLVFAIESMLDDIANDQGWDPVAFREHNMLEEGDVNAMQEVMHSVGSKECLRRAAKAIDFENLNREPHDDHWVRGVGLAVGTKLSKAPTSASAAIKVHDDGRIEVRTSAEEIGTGTLTALSQIAAEEFGVELDNIQILHGDTRVTPYDEGAISSRITFNTGNAVRKACIDAKEQLFEHAAVKLDADPANLTTEGGKVFVDGDEDKQLTFQDLFEPVKTGGGFLMEGGEIIGTATWNTPIRDADPETGQGARRSAFYMYVAQACDLEINTDTGAVRFNKFVGVADAGKAINPKMVEGQIEGGISMGLGSALYEELTHDEGRFENPNFLDYKVPFSTEHPLEVHTEIVESAHREGPYGAKGVGDVTLTPTAAAIGNAIKQATGTRLTHIPFTPEKILDAVDNMDA